MSRVPASDTEKDLRAAAAERILVLDGAMGTMIQTHKFTEADFRGTRFADWPSDLRGNNDLLVLTQPHAIEAIHFAYCEAGADIIATNTFSSTRIAQADYGMEELVAELNREAARLCRRAADRAMAKDGRRRFVAGAMGPTNRTASISPDVNNPGFRAVTFDELRAAYAEAAEALIEGGADVLLIETIFDTLNAKAAYAGIDDVFEKLGRRLPVMISGTITDLSGRTLSGQTPTAFWYSLQHTRPAFDRAQLRARRTGNAGASRRAFARRRHSDLRLSQCGPAERIRPLRRESGLYGGPHWRIRGVRPRQYRGRLLRYDARAYPRNRQACRGIEAARSSRDRAAIAAFGARAVYALARHPLRQCRRAHQCHRLGSLPKIDQGGRFRRRARCRARPGDERRAGHRHQHG